MSDFPPPGVGSTTLDYLYACYPWLKSEAAERDKAIKDLKALLRRCRDAIASGHRGVIASTRVYCPQIEESFVEELSKMCDPVLT